MHNSPIPPHNPLTAAASQAMHAAREAKSPLLEKLAIGTMVLSAVVSTAVGVIHVARMVRHDDDKADQKAYRQLLAEMQARDRLTKDATARGRY